ncbi:hypothetical protein ILUMI_21673 [Ignelater luminosus]|uniref:DDE Tnp4 domain-containing protein n=1 Tax=Ignelater luminosus TaxID=2038154 RepID=A0A8K0CC03_IGNLU|nr:hypothetical protein ILUMI_21673 [Ignelater luminosus]
MYFLSSLAADIIKPPSVAEKEQTTAFYYHKAGIPNVIGCIDGSHIEIDKPTERSVDYINRKGYHSIVLQGLCNEHLNFIDIFIGYPGSVHDARVFRNSSLYSKLQTVCGDKYILGDSAYPQSPQLLTPYKDNGHLTAAQKYFNKKLSTCRVDIEHVFGLCKQRFRQLYHVKLRGRRRPLLVSGIKAVSGNYSEQRVQPISTPGCHHTPFARVHQKRRTVWRRMFDLSRHRS